MQFRINEIGLFRENKKDIVKFKNEINFISGESNTGKSSIGEIIDYCLASSKSTIAKGEKINSTDVFAINIKINNYNIVIARNHYNKTERKGEKYIFLKRADGNFSFDSIDISWFKNNDLNYMNIKNFKEIEIVKYFPKFPPKTRLDGKEMVRPTIRSMIPFMLQTQDIIKNKNHLFYQMDKSNKVKQIKRDFELFLGIINYSIYVKINRKNELIKEIKKIKNRINLYEDELKREYENLKSHYYRLFSHLNRDININEIEQKTLKNLDYLNNFKIDYIPDSDIGKKIDDLETEANQQSRILENIKIEYSNVKNQIRHIETTQNELERISNSDKSNKYNNVCPLCESNINKEFEIFIKAKEKIKKEQSFLNNYNIDILREKEKELKTKLDIEKKNYWLLNKRLNTLKKDCREIKDLENKKNLLAEIKGMIKQTIEKIYEYEEKISNQENLELLEVELENIEKELKKIDLKKKRFEAEYLIGRYATYVLNNLPFDEKDYGKPNLKFDIKEVKMYQENKSQLYYLSDLGSAENHLSFHLATFLGLHKYILENQNSILPSFIFLDQPSQVYFPSERDFKSKINEIKKVENIYKTIIDFISEWNNKNSHCNIQIIVVDHFYSTEKWYQQYLVEPRWEKDKGLGLIKNT